MFGEVADHVVGHVARRDAKGAAGGVGGKDGGFAGGDGVGEGFVGDVGDVDEDAEAVHFADYVFAEVGEAVVGGLVGGGVGPLVVVHVGESHVAATESGEGAENGEVVAHHVSAFDAHEDGD